MLFIVLCHIQYSQAGVALADNGLSTLYFDRVTAGCFMFLSARIRLDCLCFYTGC